MSPTLPSKHRALVLDSPEAGFQLKLCPTPQTEPGSATVQIINVGLLSYAREVYGGGRSYTYPTPLIGGFSAIARIAKLGYDSVALEEGQLVYVDCVMRTRDDPDVLFLSAIHDGTSPASKKLTFGTRAHLQNMPKYHWKTAFHSMSKDYVRLWDIPIGN